METGRSRVEATLPDPLEPVTAGLVAAFWLVYGANVAVSGLDGPRRHGRGVPGTVRASGVRLDVGDGHTRPHEPRSHRGEQLPRGVRRELGRTTAQRRRYLTGFLVGGALTAVCGSVLAAGVSGHLLADVGRVAGSAAPRTAHALSDGAAGSSMGLAVVLGATWTVNPTARTVVFVFVFEPRRWVAYAVVLAVSVVGTLASVWVFGVVIGHPYHLVGLVGGGVYGRLLARAG